MLLSLIIFPSAKGNDSWLDSFLNALDLDAERILVDQNFLDGRCHIDADRSVFELSFDSISIPCLFKLRV